MFDYKIKNSNIKKFFDRTDSYVILYTLEVGMPFFINICASVMKRNLSNYSDMIFYYNTNSQQIEGIFN